MLAGRLLYVLLLYHSVHVDYSHLEVLCIRLPTPSPFFEAHVHCQIGLDLLPALDPVAAEWTEIQYADEHQP